MYYGINYDTYTYTCMHVNSICMLASLVVIDNDPWNLWSGSIHIYFILGGDCIQDDVAAHS